MSDPDDRVVLFSIHEEWARAILDGHKRYEYRKQPPAIDTPYPALLYATQGPSEIIGEVIFDDDIEAPLDDLLARTVDETPHTPEDIKTYFDSPTGTALRATDAQEFSQPVSRDQLETIIPEFHPPQNFRYISQDEYERVREVAYGSEESQ